MLTSLDFYAGLIFSCTVIKGKISETPNEEEGETPQPGQLFEKITIGGERFFSMDESDGNGAGFDYRNGK